MSIADVGGYFVCLFKNHILVAISAILAFLYRFFFPDVQYLCAAAAVLGVMILDLLTKLFALSRKSGGLKKAFKTRTINSHSFGKGTFDKLVVFGVMMIICGLAYRVTMIDSIAVWFTQIVFILMFFRDVLSIIENLQEAGIEGLNPFKKVVSKKLDEYVDSGIVDSSTSSTTEITTDNTVANNDNTDHL